MLSFNQSHHISDGVSHIKADYQANNHAVQGASHIESSHHANDARVSAQNHIKPVEEGIPHKIENTINSNKQLLEQKRSKINNHADPLKAHVDEKVKGGVFGSIGYGKGSLGETIKQNNKEKTEEFLRTIEEAGRSDFAQEDGFSYN